MAARKRKRTAADAGNTVTPRTSGGVRVGVVTSEGRFLGNRTLNRMGFSLTQGEDGAFRLVEKAFDRSTEEGRPSASKEISEDSNPFQIGQDGILPPPYDFEVMTALLNRIAIHAAAIDTKANDYCYNGWRLEVIPHLAERIDERTVDLAKAEIESCLRTIADGRPIEDLCRDVAMDYEGLGIGGFEVRRNAHGLVAAVNHIPFRSCRILNGKTFEATGARYIQRRFGRRSFFVPFGDKVEYVDSTFDPSMSSPEDFPPFDRREDFVRFAGEFPLSSNARKRTEDWREGANEFIAVPRPPFLQSGLYGTPSGVQATSAMLALLRIDDYNLEFFANKGVPQYAVVIEGLTPPGTMQEPSDALGDDAEEHYDPVSVLEDEIQAFFEDKLKAANRSTLVLTAYGQANIRFEKLSDDDVDAAFEKYEKRATERIRLAHRVPGAAMGILETANLGSGRDSIQMRRYRDHIVLRGQREFESVINRIIRAGFLIPFIQFKFDTLDIEAAHRRREQALKEFVAGGISLDEFRDTLGLPPRGAENGGDLHILRTANAMFLNEDGERQIQQLKRMEMKSTRFMRDLAGYMLDDIDDATDNDKEDVSGYDIVEGNGKHDDSRE